MWILIIIGGGVLVTIMGPLSIVGYGNFDWLLTSGLKAIVAMILVVVWIVILSTLKNWIFRNELKF
jgi:hypothetical protein